jgi:hypothetical protein
MNSKRPKDKGHASSLRSKSAKRISQKYAEIRPNLNTGDIVLFDGKGPISVGIKMGCLFSKWSHVGLVIKIDDPAFPMVMLYESTTISNIEDAETGVERKGVQLVPLSTRLEKYNGNIGIRHLKCSEDDRHELRRSFASTREKFNGRPYEKSKIELVKSAWDGPGGKNQPDTSSLFCSELAAETFQRAGILPGPSMRGYMSSNEFTPNNFSTERKLQLMTGYSLSDELLIQKDSREAD